MLFEVLRTLQRKGLSAQWSASILCAPVSLGLSVVLARFMGPAVFGEYSFYLGMGAAVGIALDVGFRTLLLRERAAPTPGLAPALEKRIPGMLGHVLASSVLVALAWGLGSGSWDGPAVVLCFALITLSQWYSAWLKGAGELHREANWQLMCRFSSAALIIAGAWLLSPTPVTVFAAWALGLCLSGLLMKIPRTTKAARPRTWLYAGSLSFVAVDLATLVYHRADIILLHALQDDAAQVGRYAAAYRLYDGILLLAAPLTLLLFRRMRLTRRSGARPETSAMILALLCGLLLAGGAWGLGTPVAGYLFGAGFTQDHLIGWLFCALIFALPNGVLTQWALAHHQERWYALAAATVALFNVALNAWLIPQYSALGAAWSTAASEALLGTILLARWLSLRKRPVCE